MELSVSADQRDGLVVVAVTGDIDLAVGDRLEREITAAVGDPDATAVVVDLSGVAFLDSTGIGVLLAGRRLADAQGRGYRVVGAQDVVLQVLEITGVWSHLSGEPQSSEGESS